MDEHEDQWARVRIREDHASQSLDPPGVRHFAAGEETVLLHRAPDAWWDSFDIDGAHIVPGRKVDVIAWLQGQQFVPHGGTWPIAKQWPDEAVAQMDGRWFRLAHVGEGRYEVVDGPFGTYQRAFLSGQEARHSTS